jgi:hypothetical protein
MEAVKTPPRIVGQFPGCGLGDCDRDNPLYYPSIAKMFLTADPDTFTTAVAWLAHMRGGFQALHLEFARRYFRWRFDAAAWSIHDAYFRAIRELGEAEPGARDYLLLAGAFGWPVSLSGMTTIGAPEPERHVVALTTRLEPNVPNPFHPRTRFRYTLSGLARVKLAVYDVSGRRVRTLVDDRVREAGRHEIVWNGRDQAGRSVAPGVYFARLELNGRPACARKMVLAE